MFGPLLLLFLLSTSCAVVYRPHIALSMKNTSRHWQAKAKLQGPNVCAKETVFDGSTKIYDLAWTGNSLCVHTSVQFDCCDGWTRVPGEQGCPQGSELLPANIAADKLKVGWWVRLLTSSGMEAFFETENEPVTVFAPLDAAASSISFHNRQLLELDRATRLIDASPLLVSHVVRGRKVSKSFRNNELIQSLTGHSSIRINVYPNGLATANCVPIVTRDTITQGPVLHTLSALLPQNHIFPITDTLLREVRGSRFTAYLVQSHLEMLVRSTGPFTLFLPTDAAFDSLGPNYLLALRYDENAVRALVLNHIIDDVHCSAMLNDAVLVTRFGEKLQTRCRKSGIFVQSSLIIEKDTMAANGVVHMVDRVLVPRRATLVLDLLKSMGLTVLALLIERGGLGSMFSAPEVFTVFAPTNAALQGAERLNGTEARQAVLNHMTAGRILTTSLKSVEFLESKGNRALFALRVLRQKILVDSAEITTPDVEGLNGVVHVIDRVLTAPSQKTILQWLLDDGRFMEFLHSLRVLQPSLYARLGSTENKEKFTILPVSDLYVGYKYTLYYNNRVLWNHIIGHELLSEQIPENGRLVVATLNNGQLLMVRRGDNIFAGSAQILQKDILCKNGVIHVVRDVITDPSYY